jgi:hypothetical protein
MTMHQGIKFTGFLFAMVLLLTPAHAVDISYSTTGTFTTCNQLNFCTSGATLTGPNGLTISFTGVDADTPNISDVPPPSAAAFGLFQVTGPATGNTDTIPPNTFITTFTLAVTQLVPVFGAGTESFTSQLAGTISKSNSQLQVNFTSGTGPAVTTVDVDPLAAGAVPALRFQLGDVVYWVDEQTSLNPQNSNGGFSSINGAISSILPEPTFYTLTGSGFVGLLFMAIRRRRQTL